MHESQGRLPCSGGFKWLLRTQLRTQHKAAARWRGATDPWGAPIAAQYDAFCTLFCSCGRACRRQSRSYGLELRRTRRRSSAGLKPLAGLVLLTNQPGIYETPPSRAGGVCALLDTWTWAGLAPPARWSSFQSLSASEETFSRASCGLTRRPSPRQWQLVAAAVAQPAACSFRHPVTASCKILFGKFRPCQCLWHSRWSRYLALCSHRRRCRGRRRRPCHPCRCLSRCRCSRRPCLRPRPCSRRHCPRPRRCSRTQPRNPCSWSRSTVCTPAPCRSLRRASWRSKRSLWSRLLGRRWGRCSSQSRRSMR